MATKKPPRKPGKATMIREVGIAWMAAIACHLAADLTEWDAPGAAEARILAYRLDDPEGLKRALEEPDESPEFRRLHVPGAQRRRFGGVDLPKPEGFPGWAAKAFELWAELGVSTDFERLKEGARIEVSPYHCKVATDSSHPLFNAAAQRRATTELVEAIRAYGSVIKPIHLSVWPEDDELALFIVDGRRRWESVLRLNWEMIGDYCDELANLGFSANEPPLPPIIRSIKAEIIVDDKSSQVVRAVANHHNLAEDVIGEAREAARLRHTLNFSTLEVAAMMGKSPGTVDNLLRLAKLAPKLRERMEAGDLAPTLGYLLAGPAATPIPHKRQLACWKAVESIKKPMERLRAAEHWLKHGKLLEAAAVGAKPVSAKRIADAAEVLKGKAENAELAPFAALFAALVGDKAAFDGLPKEVRLALVPEKSKVFPWGADFSEDERQAWIGCGVMHSTAAKALRAEGLTPEECTRTAVGFGSRGDRGGLERPLGWLYCFGEMKLDEVKKRARQQSLLADADAPSDPALRQDCPSCNARAGQLCKSVGGLTGEKGSHLTRITLAERVDKGSHKPEVVFADGSDQPLPRTGVR